MEDREIIALYHRRDERAIAESAGKYGPYCTGIALRLLGVREDAEECVNDTWHAAWTRMPPELPQCLRAFLGRITRNLSISRFRAARAQKRGGGELEILLSELDDCVPDRDGVEGELDRRELAGLLNTWLDGQPEEERVLFLRRYWYGVSVGELAREGSCSPNQVSQRLLRLRRKLKAFLESEGVYL